MAEKNREIYLRLYSDFAHHPKVQMLSEANQRRYVMVLCLHKENKLLNRTPQEIAFALRISEKEWEETIKILKSNKLIDEDGAPHNWDERQYLQGSAAAERQKRYREKNGALRNALRNVTLPLRNANVTRNAPLKEKEKDKEKEEDKEKEVKKKIEKKENFEIFPPGMPEWVDQELWKEYLKMRVLKKKPPSAGAVKIIMENLTRWRNAGHDPNDALRESIQNSWTGVFEPKQRKRDIATAYADLQREGYHPPQVGFGFAPPDDGD